MPHRAPVLAAVAVVAAVNALTARHPRPADSAGAPAAADGDRLAAGRPTAPASAGADLPVVPASPPTPWPARRRVALAGLVAGPLLAVPGLVTELPWTQPQSASAQDLAGAEAQRAELERVLAERRAAAEAEERRAARSAARQEAAAELAARQAAAAEQAAREAAAAEAARPKFAAPVDVPAGSPFGRRWGRLHAGLDFPAPLGTPIRAAADGVVEQAGPAGGYGNLVTVRHADGVLTAYGHMRVIDVVPGQQVLAGQVIAQVGNEGRSTGPHLHFEVRAPGPVDPRTWLAARGVTV